MIGSTRSPLLIAGDYRRDKICLWATLFLIITTITNVAPVSSANNVSLSVVPGVGVNWGSITSHPMSPDIVVQMLKDNGFKKLKLFESDSYTVSKLAGTDIEVMLGIPNNQLHDLAKDYDNAKDWVKENVSEHMSNEKDKHVNIKYVAVGNEPFLLSYYDKYIKDLFPAMQNIQKALNEAGYGNTIKATVPLNADVYESNSNKPSDGNFRSNVKDQMKAIIKFLHQNKAPILVNIYPFLSLYQSSNFPSSFAFFDENGRKVYDKNIAYANVFDANYDTLVYALKKNGYPDLKIIVGEVGWPTAGHKYATPEYARKFYSGLMKKLARNKGTPLRPGKLDVYLFALMDEDQKSIEPGPFERHWGIFAFDGKPKFPVDLSGKAQERMLIAAKGVQYLPSQWCVLNPDASNPVGLDDAMGYACAYGDCTSLKPGSPCADLTKSWQASYAFNMYYQINDQDADACDFNGLAALVKTNASRGNCLFPIQIQSAGWRIESDHGVGLIWKPLKTQKLLKSQGINGPGYTFLVGNAREVVRLRTESLGQPMPVISHDLVPRVLPEVHRWMNKYGKTFVYWMGHQPHLVVTDSDMVKQALFDKDGNFPKAEWKSVYYRKIMGDGILTNEGKKWSKIKKLANVSFHGVKLKSMMPEMVDSAKNMLKRWKNMKQAGEEIEVFEEFMMLTGEIILRIAFGTSFDEGREIFDMLLKLRLLAERNVLKLRLPIISKIFKSRDYKEACRLEQGIRACILDIVRKREEDRDAMKDDYLGLLIQAHHERDESRKISIDDLVDEFKSLYFAGHETTSSLLSWIVLLLAIHQDWQQEARNEVFDVFGRDESPHVDGISKLKIMGMIINETLRLYPPIPALGVRTIAKDDVKLGKLTLDAGIRLQIPILCLHRDPKIWGEDANLFKPERFSEGIAKATNNNPTAFIPFGMGPRNCVGIDVANSIARVALSMILQRFSFTLSPGYVHSPHPYIPVSPGKGVQVILHAL
ncbi:Glucan endo-1,3-beta-glucosidase 8 [Linum grandiflorum]